MKFKHDGKILLGLKELIHPQDMKGRQVLAATAARLRLILRTFSWFSVKNKVPFKPSNPTS